jgi:hypothetical protein
VIATPLEDGDILDQVALLGVGVVIDLDWFHAGECVTQQAHLRQPLVRLCQVAIQIRNEETLLRIPRMDGFDYGFHPTVIAHQNG